MNRPLPRILLLVLSTWLGLVASAAAFAHAGLVKAVPAAGSQVSGAPRIELTFNEALVPRAVRVTVGKVGAPAKTHPVAVEVVGGNKVVRATPRHPLGPGEYEVEWRAAGADQHPMSGRYRFTIR